MPSPSYEKRICAMFDSFAKTVSRNYVRNLDRAEVNWDKHYADEPAEYILEMLGREDSYPSDAFVLYADGHSYTVESETLFRFSMGYCHEHRVSVESNLASWASVYTDAKSGRFPPERKPPVLLVGGSVPKPLERRISFCGYAPFRHFLKK